MIDAAIPSRTPKTVPCEETVSREPTPSAITVAPKRKADARTIIVRLESNAVLHRVGVRVSGCLIRQPEHRESH